jgi:hypothetical protein
MQKPPLTSNHPKSDQQRAKMASQSVSHLK